VCLGSQPATKVRSVPEENLTRPRSGGKAAWLGRAETATTVASRHSGAAAAPGPARDPPPPRALFAHDGRLIFDGLLGFAPVTRTVLALLTFALVACERPPSADALPEWTPVDHRSRDDDKLQASAQQAPAQRTGRTGGEAAPMGRSERAGGGADNTAQLVDLTWRQQCTTCHGPLGRGDGQMSPMFRVPDLSDEGWQSRVSDATIAATIKNGKGKMPNFDVPDEVIRGLVARVRAARGR
jgi:mono/diheme cytochrome c family protein